MSWGDDEPAWTPMESSRPVLSDDVIDALTDTIRNMTGHDSAANFYDSCGQAARPGDEPIPYSRIAAELRAWEEWRAKREGGT